MSFNHVVQDAAKPWFNSTFKNLRVDGDFTYKNADRTPGDVLKLVELPSGTLEANWRPVPVENVVYNNQASLLVRGNTYSVSNSEIVFTGFKYSHPSFFNLTADKKTLLISSPGYYMIIYSFASSDIAVSSLFAVYFNDVVQPNSFASFIPSRSLPTPPLKSFNRCTASCIVRTEPGVNALQIKIVPSSVNTLNSFGSQVNVIKLSNFD
jgi:hypothetical protein